MLPVTKKPSSSLQDLVSKNYTKGLSQEKPVYRSDTHTGQTEYSKYDIGSFAADDMQDSRANQQTNLDAWGNIIANNVGKTLTRTVDGYGFIPSALYSLVDRGAEGKIDSAGSAVASIFDNPVSQKMREAEDWLNKEFPVYQTKKQTASYSPLNLGFANSIMDGLSYVASMYLGGGAISATKNSAKTLVQKLGSKNIGKLFANAVEEGKDLSYVSSLFADASARAGELQKVDGILKQSKDYLQKNFYDYWGGLVESGAEASETRANTYEKVLADMQAKNNGQPLTDEQKELAQDRADEAGAWNFATNMVTTTFANKVVFNKMFSNKYADDMVARNRVAKEGGKYAIQEAKSKTGSYLNLFKKPFNVLAGSEVAKGIVTEGGQEGIQFASNDFFTNLYSNPSPESVWAIDNVGEALGNTMQDLRSKDAVHSMLIGGLIGGGFNAYFGRGKDQDKIKNTQKYIDQANSATTQDVIKSTAKSIDLSNAMDGAVIAGDKVTFETLKNHQVFDWAYSRNQLGKSKDLKEELTEARNLDLEEFKSKYDIEDTDYTEEKRKGYIDYLERVADDTVKSSSAIMSNYGHKIAALQQEAPDMLKYLTMVDVHKKDYIRRESELLTKIAPYMDYADLAKNILTDDKLAQIRTNIVELEQEFETNKNIVSATPEEATAKMAKLSEAANNIAKLQNIIASSITEANYKDMMLPNDKLTESLKEAKDRSKYQEFSKDLNDFKSIQKAKEETINYYHRLVNDVDYAKEVQKQINLANQSKVLKNVFSLNADPGLVTKTRKKADKTDETYEEFGLIDAGTKAGEVQDFVKPGDIYSLERSYTKKDFNSKTKNYDYENFKRYMPFEVKTTRIDMEGEVPIGMVELQSADGRRTEMSMNEFKKSLRPIQTKTEYKDYKYRLPKEEERFYKLYKNNAIRYQLPDGTTIVGMLGFNQYENGLVIKYINEEGNLKAPKFRATEYRDGEGGFLDILSADDTIAYKLKEATTTYIKELTKDLASRNKAKDTTTKLIERTTNQLNLLNVNKTGVRSAVESMIRQYNNYVDELTDEIEIKQAALDRLTTLKAIPFEVGETYPAEINEAIKDLNDYQSAALNLSLNSTGTTPKRLKDEAIAKAMTLEIAGNEETLSSARKHIKNLKQEFINNVKAALRGDTSTSAKEYLDNITDSKLNPSLDAEYLVAVQATDDLGLDASLVDSITGKSNQLLDKTIESRNEIETITNEYRDKILNELGSADTLRDKYEQYRYAEYKAIVSFGILINSSGYWPTRVGDMRRKVTETTYDLEDFDHDIVTRRPEFVLKSTMGNTTNPHKQVFEDVLFGLHPGEISARVIPASEYAKYQLDADGSIVNGVTIIDPIYIALTDKSGKDIEVKNAKQGSLTPITSLPLLTLNDTFGSRFRDAESVPNIDEINSGLNSISNSINYLKDLDIEYQSYLADPDYNDVDRLYATKAVKHLTDLYNFRETIKATNGNVQLEISGKSNGRPEFQERNSDSVITPTGSIFIAESLTSYIGDKQYPTTPGRAYFNDEGRGLFFPIIVNRLGDTKFTYGKNGTAKKTYVDNIIDAGKFIQASYSKKAFYTGSANVKNPYTLSDALVQVNNYLSRILYQNTNGKPEALFNYTFDGKDVIFQIGKDSFNLSTQEELVKEALKGRLFNIDKKSTGKEVYMPVFSTVGDEVNIISGSNVKYDDLVKESFGIKSNIKKFKNGYVTFSGKVSELAKTTTTVAPIVPTSPSTVTGNPRNMANRVRVPKPNAATPAPLVTPQASEPEVKVRTRYQPEATTPAPVPTPESTTKAVRTRNTGNKSLASYYKGNGMIMSAKEEQRARKLFRDKYDVSYTLVKGLVDNDAFGMVTNAAKVLISTEAPSGTERHEEFHLVSQHILTPGELVGMYNQAREEFNDTKSTDDILEEKLANGYDLHTKGYKGIFGKLNEWYDLLTKKIRALLNLQPRIQDVYNDIYRGKYYGKPVYKGTTSYKMKKYDGEERDLLEQIPEFDRLKAYKAATSNFVLGMRDILADNIGKTEFEIELESIENRTPQQEQLLAGEIAERKREALVRLITNSGERRAVIQGTTDGESNFNILLENSLNDYTNAAIDTIAAKFNTATDPNKPYGDTLYAKALEEFTAVVTKELSLVIPEDEEVDEYTTDKGVVKKGDTEVDFFQESQTQLKLLAYTHKLDDGVYPINVATFNKILFENLTNKESDDDFFDTLSNLGSNQSITENYGEAYRRAVDNTASMIGLYDSEMLDSDAYMQQMIYGVFNKQDVSYQVMKISDSEDGKGLNYYFVDQSKEKNREDVRKEFMSGLSLNFEGLKSSSILKQYKELTLQYKRNKKDSDTIEKLGLVDESAKGLIFETLTNSPLTRQVRKDYPIIDTVLSHFALFEGTLKDYLLKNRGNVSKFVEIMQGKAQSKIFALTNAKGNPQYSLQSPSSIHNELAEYHENLDPDDASELRLDSFVNLNGTQYTAKAGKSNQETKYAAASDLIESDLLAFYYEALTNKDNPMIPYIFNGDKSSIGGFKLSGKFLNKEYEGLEIHQNLQRKIFRKELNDLLNFHVLDTKYNKVKTFKELPFFSFMKVTNPKTYESILKDVLDVSKDNDTVKGIDSVYNNYEDIILGEALKYFGEVASLVGQKFAQVGFKGFDEPSKLSSENIKELEFFARAFALANYEQTKLTGSLSFYKDPAKRLYAWTSAKAPINTSNRFLNYYNDRYNSNMTTNYRSLVVDDVPDMFKGTMWEKNNPSDAQAWITLDTARFMLFGSGKYNSLLDETFQAVEELENKATLTAQDMGKLNDLTRSIGEQINILKPQGFGNQDINGIKVPTFYKFSVFPLSNAIAKGKNLENILKTMKDNNINILMVDSANKVGRMVGQEGLPMYDKEGNFVLDSAKAGVLVQSTPWKGIGLQVDMPNAHSNVSAGTQMRKLITENLTNPELIKEHEDLLRIKTNTEIQKLQNDLGLDDDFTITKDNLPKIKDKILKLASLSASTSFGLMQDIKDLGSYDLSTNKAKLQGIFNSLLSKNIIRQKINGDSKAMVSSVGFEKINGGITKDNRLKFYEDEDGKRYMEVYLPYSQYNDYKNFTYYDQDSGMYLFKTPKENEREAYDRVMSIIGYRIPTQAQASIENIKIKGFLPQAYGNAIVVPFEITSKAGSDFDIDKLNLYMPKFSKGEYSENHIDNKLLRFYTSLMSSAEYYPLFVKSIDGKSIERISHEIEEAKGIDKGDNTNYYNFFNPVYLANRRDSFITAKNTLGAAALATTHHAESQKHKLSWREIATMGNTRYSNIIGNASLGTLLSKFIPSFRGVENIRFDRIYMLKENGEDSKEFISDKLSEFVNAFVDAAKDDYITSANIDLKTIGVAMMLIRTGIPENLVLNFLAQPGVVAYTTAQKEAKSNTRRSESLKEVTKDFALASSIDAETDIASMKANLKDKDAKSLTQSQYVALYKDLDAYAQILSNLQQVTTFDTKATDKMIELNELNLMKYDNFMANNAKYWNGVESMTNANNSFQAQMREVARKSDVLTAKFFNIKYLYNNKLSNVANKALSAAISEIQNKEFEGSEDKVYKTSRINNMFISWLVQKQTAKYLGGEDILASTVGRTIQRLNSYNGQNQFVKGLRAIDKRVYSHSSASLSAEELNLRQAAFQELMYEDLDFAKDIIYAGIATHGFVNNPFSYMNQIPGTTILDAIGVIDKDAPLLSIYDSFTKEELSRGVTNAVSHAARGYSDVVSNYVLESVDSAPKKLDESYKCN